MKKSAVLLLFIFAISLFAQSSIRDHHRSLLPDLNSLSQNVNLLHGNHSHNGQRSLAKKPSNQNKLNRNNSVIYLPVQAIAGDSERVSYSCDNNGNRLTDLNERWVNNAWVDFYRHTYTYDNNGNQLTDLSEYWTNITWVNSSRYSYTYDNNGNQLTDLSEYWTNNTWVNSSRYSYTYDNNGNQLTDLSEYWTNNTWVNSSSVSTI